MPDEERTSEHLYLVQSLRLDRATSPMLVTIAAYRSLSRAQASVPGVTWLSRALVDGSDPCWITETPFNRALITIIEIRD